MDSRLPKFSDRVGTATRKNVLHGSSSSQHPDHPLTDPDNGRMHNPTPKGRKHRLLQPLWPSLVFCRPPRKARTHRPLPSKPPPAFDPLPTPDQEITPHPAHLIDVVLQEVDTQQKRSCCCTATVICKTPPFRHHRRSEDAISHVFVWIVSYFILVFLLAWMRPDAPQRGHPTRDHVFSGK